MTYKQICEQIADELNRRGIVIRNTRTGLVVRTGEDVWNFDSHGELFHIWDWYERLFGHPLS